MSVAQQIAEIAARPLPDEQHYDATDMDALLKPRVTNFCAHGKAVPDERCPECEVRVAECIAARKPRKPRAPSKKMREATDAAYERGVAHGLNLRDKDRWPGAAAAALLGILGFVAGSLIF